MVRDLRDHRARSALGSLATRGLNLGIDFKGGTRITTTLVRPATQSSISSLLTKIDPKMSDAIVQGRGSSTSSGGYKQFQIEDKTLSTSEVQKVQIAIAGKYGIANGRFDSRVVSAAFGSEILTGAIYAVIFSLLLIVAYVSARFEWKYAAR